MQVVHFTVPYCLDLPHHDKWLPCLTPSNTLVVRLSHAVLTYQLSMLHVLPLRLAHAFSLMDANSTIGNTIETDLVRRTYLTRKGYISGVALMEVTQHEFCYDALLKLSASSSPANAALRDVEETVCILCGFGQGLLTCSAPKHRLPPHPLTGADLSYALR